LASFELSLPRPGAILGATLLGLVRLGDASAADNPPAARVEARSADLLTVGVVQNDRMSIHISRLSDNVPLRDAVVTVVLRGRSHPTVAETDGSFTLVDADLKLPGAAAVEFQVSAGVAQEALKGTLDVQGRAGAADEKSQARQYWWWALNFGVCIGFLVLISRRKKKSADKEPV
jgi:hypothetical protein